MFFVDKLFQSKSMYVCAVAHWKNDTPMKLFNPFCIDNAKPAPLRDPW